MANIPVEETSTGAAWLPWLLGLLALAAIGFFIFQAIDDPDNDDVVAENAAVDDAETAAPILADDAEAQPETVVDAGLEEITSVDALNEAIAAVRDGAADPDGVDVNLTSVEVMALTGDSTFAIGTGDDRTLVVLSTLGESETGPGDGSDGVFDVDLGDTVSIDGSLMRFNPGMRGTSDLSTADRDDATRRQYVIAVREVSDLTVSE